MDIALARRRENIAEYILYLWQLEDMLRALQFSPEAVYSQLVKPRKLDAEQETEFLTWYMDIADLLRQEDKEKSGHINHTIHLINELQNFHAQLMQLPVGERYRGLYSLLEPELPGLRQAIGRDRDDVGDIEMFFRALYAVMLYRIKGDKLAGKISSDVMELISPVVAELARVYRLAETGRIDLFADKPE